MSPQPCPVATDGRAITGADVRRGMRLVYLATSLSTVFAACGSIPLPLLMERLYASGTLSPA